MDKKIEAFIFILIAIVAIYGGITYQWGLLFSVIWYIVVIILVLIILQKSTDHFRASEELNRKMSSDLEALNKSVADIKEEIRNIRENCEFSTDK